MGINLIYERANEDAFELLEAGVEMLGAGDIGELITNDVFPTVLNKVGETITRDDVVQRNYAKFKIPLSQFGAITEYLASNMVKATSPVATTNGTIIDDFVINNPDIQAIYTTKLVRANYPLTIQQERWLDAIDSKNITVLASMIAIATQALYDGITHDHDSMIPALLGTLYEESPETAKRKIPNYSEAKSDEDYSKKVFSILNKSVRDMTTWRRADFNYMKMEMVDAKADLALVVFEEPIGQGGETVLDVITAQLNIGAKARAEALGDALGIDVYEMPSAGIIENSVAQAYSISGLKGMQTADMSNGEQTSPYPKLKFALVGKGAVNVGLKRLQVDSGRSIRAHLDQTWVQPTIQLAFGAGQAIFFTETDPTPPPVEEPKDE